jgi:hypothetical protein
MYRTGTRWLTLWLSGEHAEARQLLEEAARLAVRVLGAGHPTTLQFLENLDFVKAQS